MRWDIFYQKYPQICETTSHRLRSIGYLEGIPEKDDLEIDNTELEICETTSHKFEIPPEILISRLSFSHIREIMQIEDSFERFFYELECIKGLSFLVYS